MDGADRRRQVLAARDERPEGPRGAGILIAIVDGLKGFAEAITAVFPDTTVQTCIVPLIRNSIRLASWKDRKPLAEALKPVYQADNAEAAEQALGAFESGEWGQRFPTVAQSWRRHWDRIRSSLRNVSTIRG